MFVWIILYYGISWHCWYLTARTYPANHLLTECEETLDHIGQYLVVVIIPFISYNATKCRNSLSKVNERRFVNARFFRIWNANSFGCFKKTLRLSWMCCELWTAFIRMVIPRGQPIPSKFTTTLSSRASVRLRFINSGQARISDSCAKHVPKKFVPNPLCQRFCDALHFVPKILGCVPTPFLPMHSVPKL